MRRDAPRKRKRTRLTAEQVEDCRAFVRLFDALAARHQRLSAEKVTYNWLQAKTGVANTTWGAYYRAERPIAEHHMNILAVLLKFRPQDHFKTYPYPSLVLIAPDKRIPWLHRRLSTLLEPDRGEFIDAIRVALKATRNQRIRIVAAVRQIATESDDAIEPAVRDEKASAG